MELYACIYVKIYFQIWWGLAFFWSGVPRDEIARENLRGLVWELTWCKASTAPLPTARRQESPPPLPPPAVAPTKRSQPECIVKQEAARESKCSVAPATAQPLKRVKVEPEPQTGKSPPHPSAPLSQTFKKELSEISKRHMPVPVKAGSSRVCWDVFDCLWLSLGVCRRCSTLFMFESVLSIIWFVLPFFILRVIGGILPQPRQAVQICQPHPFAAAHLHPEALLQDEKPEVPAKKSKSTCAGELFWFLLASCGFD